MIDDKPGVALDRSLVDNYAAIERRENEIDDYIRKRHRAGESGSAEAEAAWAESERKRDARLRSQRLHEWLTFCDDQIRRLDASHEALTAGYKRKRDRIQEQMEADGKGVA